MAACRDASIGDALAARKAAVAALTAAASEAEAKMGKEKENV